MASDGADIYLRFADESGEKPAKWAGQPIQGDCRDEKHPGEDGWIQIRSFSFGFGSGDKGDTFESKSSSGKPMTAAQKAAEAKKKEMEEKKKKEKEEGKTWGKSGPLDFEKFKFSKSTDRLSPVLLDIAYAGNFKIPKVLVEAVRYGNTGASFKIPFLQLIFENVYLKSCTLNLVNEEVPGEDVEFEYDIVRMLTIWTDNETGAERLACPVRAGWDLNGQKAAA